MLLRMLLAVLTLIAADFDREETITVLDNTSNAPIEGAEIRLRGARYMTDSDGRVTINEVSDAIKLTFRHPSYLPLTLSYKELSEVGFTVRLRGITFSSEKVITAANRWEQDPREVPLKMTQITRDQVNFQNPQTSADLLSATDQVFVQKSQLGGGSPMIRGFSANRVLLVVDGVRMNNAIFRGGNLQNVISLDAHSIEGAEVIFGPGSVMYGSDAIGGVMDFHTLRPQPTFTEEIKISSNALIRTSSANFEKTGHLDVSVSGRNWASLTSVTYSDYDDLRMGSNDNEDLRRPEYVERRGGVDSVINNDDADLQRPTNFSQANVLQKLIWIPSDAWEFQYGFNYSETSDVPRYDRLIEKRDGQLRSAEWYYGPQKWLMNSLRINHSRESGLYHDLRLIAAFQHYEESRNDRKFGNNWLRSRVETVDALSFNADFDKPLNGNDSLFYGGEIVVNYIGSEASQRNIVTNGVEPISTRYPDGSEWKSLSAYLSYKSNINDKITLVAGGRYNQVLIDTEFDTTFFPFPFESASINTGALNASLGAVYRPDNSWQFNLNLTTGFRAPNIDDVGKVFDSEPGSVVVPNPDLSSEYAWNADFAVIRVFGALARIEVTAFYTLLQDAMVRRDFSFSGEEFIFYDGELSRVQAIQNADEATVYGGHIAVDAFLSQNILLRANINYARGETLDGEALRHVAPLYGRSHLIFTGGKYKADLYAEYNGEISFENLAPTERSKTYMYSVDENGNPFSPGWLTLNLKFSYDFSERLLLNVGLENILDKRYRPYSSGIAAPARNFIVGIRSKF